jgi:DNA modification methylase
MKGLLKNGYKAQLRPSGHDISDKFSKDNGASIPPNLIAIANTESNSAYLTKCKEKGIKPHPARFPVDLPEYFIRMLSDKGDFVFDPFGGSCVTGEAAERLKRKWVCVELEKHYIEGGRLRFPVKSLERKIPTYKLSHPGALWNGVDDECPLPVDGGKERPAKPSMKREKDASR